MLDIFEGLVNNKRFIKFLENNIVYLTSLQFELYSQAPQLIPYPSSYNVIVLDNCAIHYNE